jgi:putative flavoprotein involved in K+ transport
MPDGRVLVVGGGNTGYQIAAELAASREVHISIGSPQKPPRSTGPSASVTK